MRPLHGKAMALLTWQSMAGLLAGCLVLGGVVVGVSKDAYYCGDTGIVMQCYKTSSYYSLPAGKCWSTSGNRLCRSGWQHVEPDVPVGRLESSGNGTAIAWLCSHEGCVPK